jgi:Type II secretion system (T2SS), protein E, N-terminal domain
MARKKLGEMMIEAGVLTEQSVRVALAEQRRWGGTLGRTLVEMKLVTEPELVRVLSQQLGVQPIDLDKTDIHPTVLELVPGEFAEQANCIPFAQPMKFLDVAMADPTNLGVIDELRIRTQLNIRPHLAGPHAIERALAKFYRRGFGRMLTARNRDEISINTDDMISPSDTGSLQARPDSSEIDAARRREGLPSRPRPTRPPPLDMSMTQAAPDGRIGPPPVANRDAEIDALQDRISRLEALVERDEGVLRKVLALLVEKGVATRDEIMERIR